jgi:hypothetical protein
MDKMKAKYLVGIVLGLLAGAIPVISTLSSEAIFLTEIEFLLPFFICFILAAIFSHLLGPEVIVLFIFVAGLVVLPYTVIQDGLTSEVYQITQEYVDFLNEEIYPYGIDRLSWFCPEHGYASWGFDGGILQQHTNQGYCITDEGERVYIPVHCTTGPDFSVCYLYPQPNDPRCDGYDWCTGRSHPVEHNENNRDTKGNK